MLETRGLIRRDLIFFSARIKLATARKNNLENGATLTVSFDNFGHLCFEQGNATISAVSETADWSKSLVLQGIRGCARWASCKRSAVMQGWLLAGAWEVDKGGCLSRRAASCT